MTKHGFIRLIEEALHDHDEALFTTEVSEDTIKVRINGADFNQDFIVTVELDTSPRE